MASSIRRRSNESVSIPASNEQSNEKLNSFDQHSTLGTHAPGTSQMLPEKINNALVKEPSVDRTLQPLPFCTSMHPADSFPSHFQNHKPRTTTLSLKSRKRMMRKQPTMRG